MDWATAQDKVIALEPEFLVPCHGAPIQGKAVIKEVLGNYRDAILHVHNAVLKGIQNGNSIESIIATAALPPNLAGLPYLQPYYGCIPYSARAIYDSYVGWFDGNPANLSPLSRKELGAELLEMMGSTDKILVHAEKALKVQKYQAALEFCDMVLGNDPKNKPARLMKITSPPRIEAVKGLQKDYSPHQTYKLFNAIVDKAMETGT
jgi:alkyl sulfatase BDS1-like metallo-beta-lactamase superfamily hydrolase